MPKQENIPMQKELVLLGGGHSQAISLKLLGMKPLPSLRLTLISDVTHTPYSGMLPAHVAGFYSYDESHIDLRRLASFAKANFYLDKAIGLDLINNQVICANRPAVKFDYLSIDIGSTPDTISVKGAKEYTIPAKPVPQFLAVWNDILAKVNSFSHLTITIVGGGAGGVELALNIHSRLSPIIDNLEINLIHQGDKVLSGHNKFVSNYLEKILLQKNIKLHLSEIVTEVLPNQIICQSGLNISSDYIFWVTNASAPSWIKNSGITTDECGFILVNNNLQSLSHPHIFATGDIATIKDYPRPKAGVFAVRQGKPLFNNLKNIITHKQLISYYPQKRYLSLIGTGDKSAVASWSFFGLASPLFWTWKDYIDRKFMNQFADLPTMDISNSSEKNPKMYCKGCGSKVGSSTLSQVLDKLEIKENKDIIIGLNNPDDAAVVQIPSGQLMVHTIDYFTSIINDPYIFGKIATNHCLSDIFAMGGTPQNALAVVTIPYANPKITENILYQLLSGSLEILNQSNTTLVGGHTTEGQELAFGLACNGLISPDKIFKKSGMKPGELLIITKAIGTGILFAANNLLKAKGNWIDAAIESMLLSNQNAANILIKNGATACTDITGFGLIGHLLEMLKASQVGAELKLQVIPLLLGAKETIAMGITSSIQAQNLQSSCYINNSEKLNNLPEYQLLFDPQTSGGLIASLTPENAQNCLQELHKSGYFNSYIIGHITDNKYQINLSLN